MKKKNKTELWLFRILLVVFPLLHLGIGMDLMDTGYSLANFEAFPDFNKTWMISTILSQVVGKCLTFLPFGNTMIGVQFYCMLILGGVALLFFEVLRKEFDYRAVLVGELIALCMCWSPKFILYQYLTYYLFSGAALLLVKGLLSEKKRLMYISGLILGASLLVRFPNIVESGLIVLVFYYAILKKIPFKKLLIWFGVCLGGYATVALTGILVIELCFGFGSYSAMIQGLFGMTEEAVSYTPLAMVMAPVKDYLAYAKYFACFVAGTIAGYAVYVFLKKEWMKKAFVAVFVAGFILILFFLRGRGIWNLQFSEYVSVYPWCMFLVYFAIMFAVFEIVWAKCEVSRKLFAMMILCILFITPIGSNNGMYSIFNNLFLVAPYVAGSMLCYGNRVVDKEKKIGKHIRLDFKPALLMCFLISCIIMIQCVCFGVLFNFRSEITVSRDVDFVQNNKRLRGMRGTPEMVEAVEELTVFMQEEELMGKEGLFYGQVPTLSYALDMPCAISHTWPELPSYPTVDLEAELADIASLPVMIYEAGYYERMFAEDAYEGLPKKEQLVVSFAKERGYEEIYRNQKFVVLTAEE